MDLSPLLTDLLPLLNEWSTADISLRLTKLSAASPAELSRLTERVLPRVGEIDEYLGSYGAGPLDETALGLLRLAECALDARQELDARGQGD